MKVRQAAVLLATFLGGYTSVALSFVVEQMCRTAHKRVERKVKKKLKRFHKWWLANPKKNTAGRRQPASTQPVQSAMSPLVRSPYSGERHWPCASCGHKTPLPSRTDPSSLASQPRTLVRLASRKPALRQYTYLWGFSGRCERCNALLQLCDFPQAGALDAPSLRCVATDQTASNTREDGMLRIREATRRRWPRVYRLNRREALRQRQFDDIERSFGRKRHAEVQQANATRAMPEGGALHGTHAQWFDEQVRRHHKHTAHYQEVETSQVLGNATAATHEWGTVPPGEFLGNTPRPNLKQ